MENQIREQFVGRVDANGNRNLFVEFCSNFRRWKFFSLFVEGLFGFSNHIYGNSTEFDKTRRGCRLFDEVLRFSTENFTKKIDDEEKFIENLFGILRDDRTSEKNIEI